MAGVIEEDRMEILERFPFAYGELRVRYLGLPLMTKKMTPTDFLPLVEKIRNRINTWTSRALSFAGRLQLINSVIISITNFWMSAFRLPKACVEEIDKLCAAFLWSGPALNPHKAKVAWKDVCKPKEEGGLGLRSLEDVNKICCLKLIWRILSSKDSLWVNWIKKHLFRKESFWSVSNNTTLGSWMWKKLLKYRRMAREFHTVEVGNGNDTMFWYDTWSRFGCIFDMLGARGIIDLGIGRLTTVGDVLARPRRRRHRKPILQTVEKMIQERRNTAAPYLDDLSLWKGKGGVYKPVFSSKEVMEFIREPNPKVHWHKGVWFTHATPKFSFLVWLAMKDRLATGDRIMSWSNNATTGCVFCPHRLESRNHLFFECSVTGQVWEKLVRNMLRQRYVRSWERIVGELLHASQDRVKLYLLRYVFQVTVHALWTERNGRRHGEPHRTVSQMVSHIDKVVRAQLFLVARQGDVKLKEGLQIWFSTR